MFFRSTLARIRTGLSLGLNAPGHILKTAQHLRQIDSLSDAKERYNAQFNILQRLASAWGFQIYNRHLMWLDEAVFWNTWNEIPEWKDQRPDRKFILWSMARNTTNLPGDSAECGVLSGASSYLICAARSGMDNSLHHAFDSFQGLSFPSERDRPTSEFAPEWKRGDLSVTLEHAQKNLSRFSAIKWYKGWIPTRFPEVAGLQFSFVHIDVDLYQPTKDSLEFFYPRLVRGGIILCDDYGSHMCMGARKAFDEFVSNSHCPEHTVIHLPTGQGFIVKR